MIRIFFLFGLFISSLAGNPQSTDFERDILRFLRINGVQAGYDLIFEKMSAEFVLAKPSLCDSLLVQMRTRVFEPELNELFLMMIPVYKKHFSHEEICLLIEFYESEPGSRFTAGAGRMAAELSELSRKWAIRLTEKINAFLSERGY